MLNLCNKQKKKSTLPASNETQESWTNNNVKLLFMDNYPDNISKSIIRRTARNIVCYSGWIIDDESMYQKIDFQLLGNKAI